MGLGRIGLAVAKRFSGFEIGKIIYTATKPKPEILLGPEYLQFQFVDFEQLLAESDVIIVTAAYNEKTKEIFNREAFKKMKKTAFIINNARGGLIQQNDLVEALKVVMISAFFGYPQTRPRFVVFPLSREIFFCTK